MNAGLAARAGPGPDAELGAVEKIKLKLPLRWARDDDQHIVLRNIEYGPKGFVCKCGGKEFTKETKLVRTSCWSYDRKTHRCRCGKSYIFVGPLF